MTIPIVATILLTILSIVLIAHIVLMWQLFKVMMHSSSLAESLTQILPAVIETINEAQELINEKKQRIGFEE